MESMWCGWTCSSAGNPEEKLKEKFKGKLMHQITLGSETDFDGWRKAARALVLNQVKPSEVIWSVRGHAAKPVEPSAKPLEPARDTFKVPARFVALVRTVILHRDSARFTLLYHLLWRLRTRYDLLDIA